MGSPTVKLSGPLSAGGSWAAPFTDPALEPFGNGTATKATTTTTTTFYLY